MLEKGCRVLLTGASGFIGRRVLAVLLKKGYEVHALDCRPSFHSHPLLFWHQCDLFLDTKSLLNEIKAPTLLHFAWYMEPSSVWESPLNFHWVEASIKLLRNFKESGGKRVVMAGSCAEYAWQETPSVENETPLAPTSFYGICKNALRELSENYCKKTNLLFSWGRIFYLFGPHEATKRFLPSLILPLLRGEEAHCLFPDHVRDFLYVDEVAEAFAALAESEVEGTVNIASGQGYSLGYMAKKVAEQMEKSSLLKLGGGISSRNNTSFIVADTQRLNKEVGWQPKLSLEEGLMRTLQWWRSQVEINPASLFAEAIKGILPGLQRLFQPIADLRN